MKDRSHRLWIRITRAFRSVRSGRKRRARGETADSDSAATPRSAEMGFLSLLPRSFPARLEDHPLLLLRDPDDAHRLARQLVLLGVAHALELEALALVQVVELPGGAEAPRRHLLLGGAVAQLVEDVVVALRVGDGHLGVK